MSEASNRPLDRPIAGMKFIGGEPSWRATYLFAERCRAFKQYAYLLNTPAFHNAEAVRRGHCLFLIMRYMNEGVAKLALQPIKFELAALLLEAWHQEPRWAHPSIKPSAHAPAPALWLRAAARPRKLRRRLVRAGGSRSVSATCATLTVMCLGSAPRATSGNAEFSRVFMCGNNAGILLLEYHRQIPVGGRSSVTSRPPMRISPASGASSPSNSRRIVDLPHPGGPIDRKVRCPRQRG